MIQKQKAKNKRDEFRDLFESGDDEPDDFSDLLDDDATEIEESTNDHDLDRGDGHGQPTQPTHKHRDTRVKKSIHWNAIKNEQAASKLTRRVRIEGRCALWTPPLVPGGYGSLLFENSNWMAHRLSYMLHHQLAELPGPLYHTCANNHCISVEHLTTDKFRRYLKRY